MLGKFDKKNYKCWESDTDKWVIYFNSTLMMCEMIRYITSDCGAVSLLHHNQGYAKSPEDAVADVLRAGILSHCLLFT